MLSGPDDKAVAAAKTQFKSWVEKLVSDPAQAALAMARRDYRASMFAYRDNAEIYRGVTKRNETLSYNEASAYLQNQQAIARLLSAKALEAQLSGSARDLVAATDQGALSRFSKRLQTEVIDKANLIKTIDDLERKVNDAIRKIAMLEISFLKKYDLAVQPSVIRFSMPNANGAGASELKPSGCGRSNRLRREEYRADYGAAAAIEKRAAARHHRRHPAATLWDARATARCWRPRALASRVGASR